MKICVRVPPERATYHEINETFEKSYLLIGLSKFAQTFAVTFLNLPSIHPICINAWGSFSFNHTAYAYFGQSYVMSKHTNYEISVSVMSQCKKKGKKKINKFISPLILVNQ